MDETLFIRADSTAQIGTGHIMRCIALSQAWQDRGGRVTFISHCESELLRQRMLDEGFRLISIPHHHPNPDDLAQTINYIKCNHPSPMSPERLWLILDGYHFDSLYQKEIRNAGYKLLVIDDNNHLPHYCADILLNQNIHAPMMKYSCCENTVKLLGPKYVLLRREFNKYKNWKRIIPKKAKNILITMGGADPNNVTLKVIKSLDRLTDRDLEVKVLVGPSNPYIEILKNEAHLLPYTLHLLHNAGNMSELMAWADIAITAGGSTIWELAFMCLPGLIVKLAVNQEDAVNRLAEVGGIIIIGDKNFGEKEAAKRIDELINNYNLRYNLIQVCSKIINKKGPQRIIDNML